MESMRSQDRSLSPDEALATLMEGNAAYVGATAPLIDYSAARAAATEEHAPIAAILGCGDARVAAEVIFSREPGDLFMVRLAGNFLSDYGLASMEFCVDILRVPLLMVLGHTRCGAVTSAIHVVEHQIDLPGRMFVMIDAIEPSVLIAKARNPPDLLAAATEENVRRQVRRLRTISPVINGALTEGRVRVVGAIYDMDTGAVQLLDDAPSRGQSMD